MSVPDEREASQMYTVCRLCGLQSSDPGLSHANFCPRCGKPTEIWHDVMCTYLSRSPSSPRMAPATQQFYKREYQAAARTALIALEEDLRERTQTELYGNELISKAFAFRQSPEGEVHEWPAIRVNDLSSDADRNEHEGIKLLFMGTVRGIRNIVAHHNSDFPVHACVRILGLCDLLLDIADKGSIKNERVCVWRRSSDDPDRLIPPH